MAGRYQAYPEYKDSGVEWLGRIPTHWIHTSLKRYCDVTDGSHHSPKIRHSGKPFVSVSDVGINMVNFEDSKKISHDDYLRLAQEGCKPKPGEVLLTKDGTIGRAAIVKDNYPDFVILSSLGLLSPSLQLSNLYLYYYLISGINIDQMNSLIHGSALRRLTIHKIDNLIITTPTLSEQTKIAHFLDHETAKIDALISRQEQLITLLKEKRQAVISHAVTKGLNPAAPMRDSAVAWLGEVPAHWTVCTLARHATFIDGDRGREYPNDNDLKDEGIVFLSSKNIVDGVLNLHDIKFISHEKFKVLNRGKALDGDLIVKVRGSVGRIGELAKFEVRQHGYDTAFINAQMMIIRTDKHLLPSYLNLVSHSQYWKEQLFVGAYGTAQQQLSNEVFSTLKLTVPSLKEQRKIIIYLERKNLELDTLINKAQLAISLMQERRTALISAAVSGKIDVRNWQPPSLPEKNMEMNP